ncbi:hypothetical protein M9458_016952, partial [Cirrhinus mrigala]
SLPVPGSHTYAGASASFPPPAAVPRQDTGGGQWDEGEGRQEVRERTAEETLKLRQSLVQIFPEQESVIIMILQCHPTITDVNRLTNLILEQQE